jgi:hypothetical protein
MPRRNHTVRNCQVCKRSRRLGRYSRSCRACTRILNPREDRRWTTTSTTR